MRIALNRKTLAEVDGLPVNKICANCGHKFITVDATKSACKFCRAADDDLRRRLAQPAPAAATARRAGAGRTDLWTEDMVAALRAAVALKQTSKQIADALNTRFGLRLTRNAVIGKCKRLEIQRSDKSKAADIRKPNPARKQPKPSRQTVPDRGGAGFVTTIGNRNALPLLPASSPPQAPPRGQPGPAPVLRADGLPHDMLSLPWREACKWPVDGEGKHTRFCGHVVAGFGEPYCETHAENSVTRAGYSWAAQ